jgi:hypothetical protein
MEYRVRVNILSSALAVAAVVGVSIITSVVVASRAYADRSREARKGEQTMSVKGSARQRITSDLGVWRVHVRAEGPDLPAAYAQLERSVELARAFLGAAGFAEAELKLEAIDTNTFYERDAKGNFTRKVEGYALTRSFTISTPDVRKVERAAGDVTRLIKDGVMVTSDAPEYLYTKLPELRVAILGEASKDARSRADEIARNSGCRVAEVRSAFMGPMQVVRPNGTDVSAGGIYDTGTIDKDVTVVVTLSLAIEPETR